MLDAILLYDMGWITSGVEGTTENLLEFSIETTDTQLFEVEILFKDLLFLNSIAHYFESRSTSFGGLAIDIGLILKYTIG
jgi:hypothetical protein